MKRCPKCKKQYDNTWKICVTCSENLVDEEMNKIPPEIISEFNTLKSLAASFSDRIEQLENRLKETEKEKKEMPREETRPEVKIKEETIPASRPQVKEEKKEERETQSLESTIGRVWFNRIGVLAIILGVSFFLKYAFDNNWIGPLGRIVLGLLVGLGMIIAGEYTHRKNYKIFAEGLIAGGSSILYLSIYVAVNFYNLIDALPGLVFMIVVTLFAGTFALRFNSSRVIAFSIIGGFLTPFLISMPEINSLLLMSYILLLDIGILWVSYFKKWENCNLLALVLTYITFFCWQAGRYKPENFLNTQLFLTAYFVLFSLVAILYNFMRKKQATAGDMAVVIFNGIFYFMADYRLFRQDPIQRQYMGFFSIALALVYLIFSYNAYRRTQGKDRNLILVYLSMTILFATMAIPLQLKYHWLTMGFIIEFVILIWLGFKIKSKGLRYAGLILAAVALSKLLFIDFSSFAYYKRSPIFYLIFNRRFFTYLTLISGAFISAFLYREHKREISAAEKNTATVLALSATFILLVSLSLEVNSYFAQLISATSNLPKGPYPSRLNTAVLNNIEQFFQSALWIIYSFILIIIGIFKKFRALRIMALVLFILTILKVFLIDISALGRIWRILSFIGLGCVLVITSFIYQKYKDKIFGFIGKN